MISDGKKVLNDLLENLIFEWTISVAEGKKVIQSICNGDCPHTNNKLRFTEEILKWNNPRKGRFSQDKPTKSIKNT